MEARAEATQSDPTAPGPTPHPEGPHPMSQSDGAPGRVCILHVKSTKGKAQQLDILLLLIELGPKFRMQHREDDRSKISRPLPTLQSHRGCLTSHVIMMDTVLIATRTSLPYQQERPVSKAPVKVPLRSYVHPLQLHPYHLHQLGFFRLSACSVAKTGGD